MRMVLGVKWLSRWRAGGFAPVPVTGINGDKVVAQELGVPFYGPADTDPVDVLGCPVSVGDTVVVASGPDNRPVVGTVTSVWPGNGNLLTIAPADRASCIFAGGSFAPGQVVVVEDAGFRDLVVGDVGVFLQCSPVPLECGVGYPLAVGVVTRVNGRDVSYRCLTGGNFHQEVNGTGFAVAVDRLGVESRCAFGDQYGLPVLRESGMGAWEDEVSGRIAQ